MRAHTHISLYILLDFNLAKIYSHTTTTYNRLNFKVTVILLHTLTQTRKHTP